ncbi:MAG: DUF1566 domain-containing protein [Candidatus Gracilibacteria bacterium]|nr:DUF1566 domain-containing protein [Candidatus Gracilibacteria bacterium]
MNKYKKQRAFTLVELIIVIAILAILGTIAFISLQGYSSQSRDSARISDLSRMKTSLELFNLDSGKYPIPTDGTNITYSGATAWIQGYFGESVYANVDKLDRIPTDPLINKEFVYSTISTRNAFQLAGAMEGGEVTMNNVQGIMNNVAAMIEVSASEKTAILKVSGNYNGKILKVSTGGIDCILASPSIITSSGITLEEIIQNNDLAYDSYKNLPFQYAGTYNTKGEENLNLVNTGSLELYCGDLKTLSEQTSSGVTARANLLTNLQNAYSGTTISNVGEIAEIINTNTYDLNATEQLATTIVRNNLGGKIIASAGSSTTTNTNCDFNGDTVINNTSVTAYLTDSVSFGNTCTSEQRMCNNGTLNGTYTYTGCTVSGATGTFNLSQTTVTQGTNVTISNTCSEIPTSYTSSNTAVATVAGTTITTLSAGTTDITPVGGACGDNLAKTLTVTTILYTNLDGSFSPYIPDGANGVGRFTLVSGTVGDGGYGVILDNITGLYWMSDGNILTTKSWTNAKTNCANLSLGGYTDWRLPDYTELKSIVDLSVYIPSINTSYFSSSTLAGGYYWTSTSYAALTTNAWVVVFTDGTSLYTSKTDNRNIRCVR